MSEITKAADARFQATRREENSGEQLVNNIVEYYRKFNLGQLDPRVITALKQVRRENYLPVEAASYASDAEIIIAVNPDEAFEFFYRQLDKYHISHEQVEALQEDQKKPLLDILCRPILSTISQAGLVAFMVQQGLPDVDQSGEKSAALEIGAGSGYVAALLSATGMFTNIFAIEINPRVYEIGRQNLEREGRRDVQMINAEGISWLEEHGVNYGPFSTIIVSAAVSESSPIVALVKHLTDRGKIIAPITTQTTSCSLELPGLPSLPFEKEVSVMAKCFRENNQ